MHCHRRLLTPRNSEEREYKIRLESGKDEEVGQQTKLLVNWKIRRSRIVMGFIAAIVSQTGACYIHRVTMQTMLEARNRFKAHAKPK